MPFQHIRTLPVKRPIFAAAFFITLLILTIWGDRLAGRALDDQLGPLLTRELGLPVSLAPIQARLLGLRASTARLVMGDPNDPAVVATDVSVTLAWSDLFKREIRLVTASGADLMLKISRWPSSDDPLPENYDFLDQWLPQKLTLDSGRYVAEGGFTYAVKNAQWRRLADGGAAVQWSQSYNRRDISQSVTLDSLPGLLGLKPISLDIALESEGQAESKIQLQTTIKPGMTSGYVLQTNILASGIAGEITTGHDSVWRLPEKSATRIEKMEPDKLASLYKYYSEPSDKQLSLAPLDKTLPVLELPQHSGTVTIGEIRLGDELGKDTAFAFTSSAQGLQISELTSNGPSSTLTGGLSVHSDPQGWQLQADAELQATQTDSSIAAQYLGADWLWEAGNAQLHGKGATWGDLLYSLQGNIDLAGHHQGKVKTAVKISAQVDNRPGEFSLEQLQIQLGDGSIQGKASLTGSGRRQFKADITATAMHLDFLFEEADDTMRAGIAIPEYLTFFPKLDVDAHIVASDVRMPAMKLAKADITFQRTEQGGLLTIEADGTHAGELNLQLKADTPPGKPSKVALTTKLDKVDIPELFQQTTLLHSRSTGTIDFESAGNGLANIFLALRGKAALNMEFRSDNDWSRATSDEERLQYTGDAALIIRDERILGLQIDKLDIDSIQQDITGSVSIEAEREPWLKASFEAEKLDVNGLLELMPDPAKQGGQGDLLASARQLGAASIALQAKSVTLQDIPLTDLTVQVSSGNDLFSIDRLDFAMDGQPLQSSAKVSWKGSKAAFSAQAKLSDFDLDRFLIYNPDLVHVPVSGSLSLSSEGETTADVLANLQGHVSLAADEGQTDKSEKSRRQVEMQITRIPDGMRAQINKLVLGRNELAGSVEFHRGTPPALEVKVDGGEIWLNAWEDSAAAAQKQVAKKQDGSAIAEAASKSAKFLGSVLRSPARLLSGPGEAAPGDKMFSNKPLPLAAMKKYNANITGQLEAIHSNEGTARDLKLTAKLKDGSLNVDMTVGNINRGNGAGTLALDTRPATPTANLEWSFENIHGTPDAPGVPSSGYINVSSFGASSAELASHLTGQAYLELGRGPFDYARDSLLTAEVASTMMQALIPGVDKKQPELQCGVALAVFKDGAGVTPYGYALRTDKANLIGRIEVDLKKELLQMQIDSRSREGVGISVSSVFSNTVRITGPLSDPEIVPDTVSILWRGWAAFMTAGLSVVGESVIKRALSSENPCLAVKKQIHKDMCGADQPLSKSALACPKQPQKLP